VVFATNSLIGQQAVARRGGGVALLPCYVGDSAPLLVRAPLPDTPPGRDLWMVVQPSVARMRAVRTVIDHLVAAFEEDAARFLGFAPPLHRHPALSEAHQPVGIL
jgi:DNA-binding transcriptional LysR family regulator